MEGTSVVVAQFRVPRIVLAVLCGMGLALAGMHHADCHGESAGRSGDIGHKTQGRGFAVMLFLTFFPALHIRTMAYQPIFAIAGGLCTTGLLYLFAKRNGKLLPIYFLLGGIGLASLFSSFYADHGREHGQQQLSARGKMACRKYLGGRAGIRFLPCCHICSYWFLFFLQSRTYWIFCS